MPNNWKSQNGFAIAIFWGELDHPPPAFFAKISLNTTQNKGKSKGLLNLSNSSNSIVAAHECKYILCELYTAVSCNLIDYLPISVS